VDLWLEVNGVRYQDGHTSNMIFTVAELIAYVSQFMTLEPGDVLTTGTPAGVGIAQKPNPVYLKTGDVMRLGSSRLGTQQHRIESWRQP
jgi:2-keto-4-pentenoate hydratase/2-oxohepta-3-ene-1,7-dioic acid hydratase in catechol pathway